MQIICHGEYPPHRDREAVVPAPALEKLIRKLEVPAAWEAHELEVIVDR